MIKAPGANPRGLHTLTACRSLLLPTPLPIQSLVAPPHTLSLHVSLERRPVLGGWVGSCCDGSGSEAASVGFSAPSCGYWRRAVAKQRHRV